MLIVENKTLFITAVNVSILVNLNFINIQNDGFEREKWIYVNWDLKFTYQRADIEIR